MAAEVFNDLEIEVFKLLFSFISNNAMLYTILAVQVLLVEVRLGIIRLSCFCIVIKISLYPIVLKRISFLGLAISLLPLKPGVLRATRKLLGDEYDCMYSIFFPDLAIFQDI